MHDEPIYAERVLKAGAHGYFTKEEGAEKAVGAIRQVLQGRAYLTGRLAERMLETMTGFAKSKNAGTVESLSDRELEVLELIGRGLGSAEIAHRLKLSVKTIESHRENIKTKLGLRRATELVQYAFNWVQSRTADLKPARRPRIGPRGSRGARSRSRFGVSSFPDGQMGRSPVALRSEAGEPCSLYTGEAQAGLEPSAIQPTAAGASLAPRLRPRHTMTSQSASKANASPGSVPGG